MQYCGMDAVGISRLIRIVASTLALVPATSSAISGSDG
jgi:hypothetical protein